MSAADENRTEKIQDGFQMWVNFVFIVVLHAFVWQFHHLFVFLCLKFVSFKPSTWLHFSLTTFFLFFSMQSYDEQQLDDFTRCWHGQSHLAGKQRLVIIGDGTQSRNTNKNPRSASRITRNQLQHRGIHRKFSTRSKGKASYKFISLSSFYWAL